MSKPPPQLFSVATDGGTWRKGPRQILVDWKPVWMRAAKHAPRPGNPSPDAKDNPDVLVIHRTAGATLRSGENLFTGGNGTSVHYLIDVDGYVLKLVREDEVANHAGASFWRGTSGLNDVSVGIEIVSADFQDYPPAQIKALRDVMWSIRRAAKIPLRNVVGHSDIEVFGGGNLAPSHERPHDPGIEMDWVELATRRPNLGAIGDAVALDADMSTVTVAERMTMYGGYFVNFTEPWGNGDGDSKRQWGGKIRAPGTLMTSDPIAELQRDFKTIGYSIASNAAQTTDGVFDDRLGRLCQRFHHRWFGSPSRKASWGPFRDNLRFTFETAVMVKAVLKAL
jgi:N-acetyl-anhydromuramyl-L-alanine amidase AmpD